MPWSTFKEDLGKYLVTGVITFIASLAYTEYQLAPRRNMTLVPLSIKLENSNLACTVDQEKLTDSIKRIDASETAPSLPQSDTYESYLKILSSSKLVLKEFVPPRFLPQLEKKQILLCDQQVERGAAFTLETAALLDQSTHYLLRRSCSMLYQGVEIPIRASADAKSTNHGVTEPETLLIRETASLIFSYDGRREGNITKNKFVELVQKVSKEDIELSVKCRVISSDNDIEIGGRRPYRVGALPSSQ